MEIPELVNILTPEKLKTAIEEKLLPMLILHEEYFRSISNKDDKLDIQTKIISYSILQTKNLLRSLDTSLDLTFFHCRCIFEMNAILKWLNCSDENYQKYKAALFYDLKEICEDFVKREVHGAENDQKILKNTIEEVSKQIKIHNFEQYNKDVNALKKISKIIKDERLLQDFESQYRLFSKFAHPSAFMVLFGNDETMLPLFKKIALVMALGDLDQIKTIYDSFRKELKDI